MKRRQLMRASRAIARVEARGSSARLGVGQARRRRTAPDAAWLDSSLVSIDGLPPALAWLLGITTGIAAVVVLGWFGAPVGVALALPWLAVYLVRSAGVRPTGTARSPRSTPIALLSCAAIVAGIGIVGNVLSGFMPQDPPLAEDEPNYEIGEPWSRIDDQGTAMSKADRPPEPASTSTTGQPDTTSSTGEPDTTSSTGEPTTTTGQPAATSATGQIPDNSYDPPPNPRPTTPKRPSTPKLCAEFKYRVTFDEDGTMSKRSERAIRNVASRMKDMPELEVRIVVQRKGVISTKPLPDVGEEVRDRIMKRIELDAGRFSIERRRGDGDWVEFEPANDECRSSR